MIIVRKKDVEDYWIIETYKLNYASNPEVKIYIFDTHFYICILTCMQWIILLYIEEWTNHVSIRYP